MNEKKSTETVEVDPGMGIVSEEIDPGMSVMPEVPGLMDVPTVIPELDSMLAAMPSALPAYQTTVWKNKPSTETPVDAAVMTRVEQRLVDLTNAVNGLRDSVSLRERSVKGKSSDHLIAFDWNSSDSTLFIYADGNKVHKILPNWGA